MITHRPLAALAGGLIVLALAAPLAALALRAGGVSFSAQDLGALRFTLVQAALSALISTLLAIPVARALARRRFPGRRGLITLMGAPFLLPVIVAVLGLLDIFGRKGLVNGLISGLGLPPLSIYGLHGVVLAHVFLNLPLASRMLLQGWQAIPAERFRLAESLNMRPRARFLHIEWPMLRALIPGVLATIFAICLTSFAVALTLGGGPGATTLELAIYQALRFDFDLGHAAGLGVMQTGLGALAALAAWSLARTAGFGSGQDRSLMLAPPGGLARVQDVLALGLAAGFLILPLGAIAWRGLPGLMALPDMVWLAAGRSLAIAVLSALITTGLALLLAQGVARGGLRWLEIAAVVPLATSGLVLGTGLFLALQPFGAPTAWALQVTLGVNTLLALPFAFRLILPEARSLEADYGRLGESLALSGWRRLRWLVLPRLARPLGFAAGVTAALSMGDLGVIALFAGERSATLPLVVQQLMGAYRSEAAAGAALLLVSLSFALFWLFDAGGRRAAT